MRKQFYEYIYLTRQERSGLLVVIISSFIIFFIPNFYVFFDKKNATDFSNFQKEINQFQEAKLTSPSINFSQKRKSNFSNENQLVLFPFDPNDVSKEELIQLGISKKTAQTIINFRNKGAKFFKKEDFKKVYGFKKSDYERLENYIQIKPKKESSPSMHQENIPASYEAPPISPIVFDPNTADKKIMSQNDIPQHVINTIIKYRNSGGSFSTKEDLKKIYTLTEEVYQKIEPFIEIKLMSKSDSTNTKRFDDSFSKQEKDITNIIIDINNSTAEDWQLLHGIGPSFSKRIITFRDKLGGFYSVEQVGETYGLPDSTFQQIKTHLILSSISHQININHATENDLKSHPYISWNQAKLILSYRNMHGGFSHVNELLEISAFKKEWFEKVKHYLKVE